MGDVTYTGSCHCGAVRFKFQASPRLTAWSCKCSICAVKRNTHVVVPEKAFELLQGQDQQTLYQFGSRQAKHLFCKVTACSIIDAQDVHWLLRASRQIRTHQLSH
ncbi:hypothetical protein WJX74_007880 [Apatococcus lobatus]|uniref:CENP-V/GFA domain-containing protein n=1 Tax=Apatococcus lobatus TaxID=904363 RepID=A0AAW1RF64_9CHLO